MKKTTLFGLIGTAIWIFVFISLITIDWHNFLNMPLNEKGDFFAGIFAPVAFLWLVIGYFQQGEELQLNTDALKSQQAELWRQAGATGMLVRHAERQARAAEETIKMAAMQLESSLMPNFVIIKEKSFFGSFEYSVKNNGAEVLDLDIFTDYFSQKSIEPKVRLLPNAKATIRLDKANRDVDEFNFILRYAVKTGKIFSETYIVKNEDAVLKRRVNDSV